MHEATGTNQELPRAEEQTATGSATGLRVLPIGARFALATDLVDDPQLTPETLKKFQDSMKECYKFASVCSCVECFRYQA